MTDKKIIKNKCLKNYNRLELYNFFSEPVDENKSDDIMDVFYELLHKCVTIEISKYYDTNGLCKYTLIGQIYGDINYVINLEYPDRFIHLKYYWFKADNPTINNI
jgi:hypothetical protein